MLGGAISISGIYASTYSHNMWLFVALYGGLSGFGCSINYMIPLVCSWEYFPNKRGLVTGIIVGSYGLGSFIFTQISTHIANP
jgi:MFS transporter, OFA family, oxalate/formate antiporter